MLPRTLGIVHIQSEDVLKRGGVSDVSQRHGHHDANTENKNARDRNKERCDVEQQDPPKLLPAHFGAKGHCVEDIDAVVFVFDEHVPAEAQDNGQYQAWNDEANESESNS